MLVRKFRGLRVWHTDYLWLLLNLEHVLLPVGLAETFFSSESLVDHVSGVNYHMDTFL